MPAGSRPTATPRSSAGSARSSSPSATTPFRASASAPSRTPRRGPRTDSGRAAVRWGGAPHPRENSWRTSILILTAAGIVMGRLVNPRLPAPQRRGVAYARDLRDRGDDGGHALRREHADDADDRLAARGRAAGAGGVG